MASDINIVLLSGRLVANPDLRFTARGTAAATLRLASTRYWKAPDSPEGEFRKQNVFINVETFGKVAEKLAATRQKGDPVVVRGRLVYEEWEDARGEKRRAIKLFSDDVSPIPSTSSRSGGQPSGHEKDEIEDNEGHPHPDEPSLVAAEPEVAAPSRKRTGEARSHH